MSVYCAYTNITLEGGVFMKIILSNTNDVPLYQQIKMQIKEAILKGEVEEGEVLPSIRNMANDLQVSVLTIRRVYDDLEKEGFIVRLPGIGTKVSQGNLELIKETKRKVLEEELAELVRNAKLLDMTKEDLFQFIERFY